MLLTKTGCRPAWVLRIVCWHLVYHNLIWKLYYLVVSSLFSSSHVQMWELVHKEGWAPKIWCFWNVVLKKTPESPLDYKDIKPVNPKGNQSWICIGRTDAEAEALIFWPPEELTHGKRPWCWQRLRAEREWGNREWDDWMTPLTQWTWVSANSVR